MTLVIKVGGVEFPGHGKPCNGCGVCCLTALCYVADWLFNGRPEAEHEETAGPCPALEREGERYYCGLMRSPELYAPVTVAMHGADAARATMKFLMGAGDGCDVTTFDFDPVHDAKGELRRAMLAPSFEAAAKVWGIKLDADSA